MIARSERWLLVTLVDPEEFLNELELDQFMLPVQEIRYIDIIINKKVSINTQDERGRTLLMWAALQGSFSCGLFN